MRRSELHPPTQPPSFHRLTNLKTSGSASTWSWYWVMSVVRNCFNIKCLLFDCSSELRYTCFMFKYGNSCFKCQVGLSWVYVWTVLKNLLDSFGKWKCVLSSALLCTPRKKKLLLTFSTSSLMLFVFCMSVVHNWQIHTVGIQACTDASIDFPKKQN